MGNFPRAVVGMERQVPRLDAPVLEGRRRHGLGVRHAAHAAPATSTNGAAAGRTPASTSSPATTASRSTTWSPTTTSTTRPTARTTATASRTTSVGTAAWKGRPTTRRSSALREKKKRSILATLLLSQGVPMLLAGDEIGHTQQGNNNAYCQDNEISWLRLGPATEARRRSWSSSRRVIARLSPAARLPSPPLLPRQGDPGGRGPGDRLARPHRARR